MADADGFLWWIVSDAIFGMEYERQRGEIDDISMIKQGSVLQEKPCCANQLFDFIFWQCEKCFEES
jgi:hypothetical protein